VIFQAGYNFYMDRISAVMAGNAADSVIERKLGTTKADIVRALNELPIRRALVPDDVEEIHDKIA
jgi:hypothetical protein